MSWFRAFSLLNPVNQRPRNSAGGRRRNPLRGMEPMEERVLLATITVTNTDASGPGSLAAAIALANDTVSNPGHDTIKFAAGCTVKSRSTASWRSPTT